MMLLKLLIVFAYCTGLLCNVKLPAATDPVYHKPEIVNHNLVYDVGVGENIEIDCSADGDAVLYRWFTKQQEIVNSNRFTVFAENGTMRVTSVEATDAGVYTCVATNNVGSSERNFTVDVLVPPRIFEFENTTFAEYTEGVLTCKAYGRPAPFVTFSWKLPSSTYSFFSGATKPVQTQMVNEELGETIATLQFTRPLRSQQAEYECLARNAIDSVKRIAFVAIEYPPRFDYIEKPPAYSNRRRPVHLNCTAKAQPDATIAWYRNDKLVSELDSRFLEVFNNGSESTLMVRPVDDSYFTTYKCVAVNKLGEAKCIMDLREAQPPEALAEVMALGWSTNMIGFEVTAASTGTPAEFIKYQYKEESELDWSDSVIFTRVALMKPATSVHVFGLKANTKYDFRFYAESESGTSSFVQLSHRTMCQYSYAEPKILNQITEDRAYGEAEFMESPYSDRFELTWEPIIEPCEDTIYYEVTYCLASHNDYKSLSTYSEPCTHVNRITGNNYIIGNLTADTYYAISVRGSFSITQFRFMRTARDPISGGDPRLKIYPTYSVQSIAAGSFFNLTCKSKAESVTNLSWRDSLNNPISPKSSEGVMYTEVVGDGEVMLIIPFVKYGMHGTYYCASSVGPGPEIIETFVKIQTHMGGSVDFQYMIGNSGRNGYLSCSTYEDDNTTMEWTFENNPIAPSDRYEFRTEKYPSFYSSHSLIIHNLTASDEGFYTCRKSATERRIYYEIMLEPSILNSETEYVAAEGFDLAIDCQSVGVPAPTVRWIGRNGTDVTLNSRFSVSHSGQMKIASIEEDDEGSYKCIAQNAGGRVEKTIQLKVESHVSK